MQEYSDNNVRLGWLIDRDNRTVEIYRVDRAVEILAEPKQLFGEAVLPKFVLEMQNVW